MRVILSFRLSNGNIMNLVADANSKDAARAWAINHSNALLSRNNLEVTRSCEVVDFERWSQDNKATTNNGRKPYMAAFYMGNEPVCLKIHGAGVKSAFNNIRKNYGVSEKTNMFLYDISQKNVKKSSIEVSKQVIKDKGKMYRLLKDVVKKMDELPVLGPLVSDVFLLASMLYDYIRGFYTEIPTGILTGVVSCLIYFVSPIDLIPDFIPYGIGYIDDVVVVQFAIKMARDDVAKYRDWLGVKLDERFKLNMKDLKQVETKNNRIETKN